MRQYARLLAYAHCKSVAPLKSTRPPPDDSPPDQIRILLMAAALLRFNFVYGDLIRWLEGPYTNAHRDWSTLEQKFAQVQDYPIPRGWPQVNLPRTMKVLTQGIPLKGHFQCSWRNIQLRNATPVSPNVAKEGQAIDERLRKEEKLSYHILFPRFLFRFIYGIHLCLFRVAYRYNDPKPRLCVDPSTPLHPSDDGNTNAQIPDPGTPGRLEENPPIYYGTALQRYLEWLYNLRISYPAEDILQLADDVSAAFHRILYHPAMAVAFATVWKDTLVVPVGSIFGSRSSPSWYMDPGEARAHLAHGFPNATSQSLQDLAVQVKLPPPLTPLQRRCLTTAKADCYNKGIRHASSQHPERRLPSFVDDSCTAHTQAHFRTCINMSVLAARWIFGFPQDDPNRPPCINPDKWVTDASHSVKFLGYIIDTRKMIVVWPTDKRTKLRQFISNILINQTSPATGSTPQDLSRVLGLIRHASLVAPTGAFKTLRLQFILNDVVSQAPRTIWLRRWWQRQRIKLPKPIVADLNRLKASISDDLYSPLWSRAIALLVKRQPTITAMTDASTTGMGGWSHLYPHMWRLSLEDLKTVGLPSQGRHNRQYHEPMIDQNGVHINVLEFFAIFVELWIIVRHLHHTYSRDHTSIPSGYHILLILADNSTALSWLRYATRTKRPLVRRLSRLLMAFLSHQFPASFISVTSKHIKGIINIGADILSRFEKAPSWESAMELCAQLQTLPTCQLPREMLSLLAYLVGNEPTEDWFENATTELWTLEPPTFATGSSRLAGTQTSLSPP